MRKMILALCVYSLFGCAHLESLTQKPQQGVSYVAKEINEDDSKKIGKDMTVFLASELPSAKTTIYIEPSNSVIHSVLVEELSARGFGIMETKPDQGPAISFQYYVTTLDKGVLVRMRYQDKISSRYYGRTPDGRLIPSRKVAVREATK